MSTTNGDKYIGWGKFFWIIGGLCLILGGVLSFLYSDINEVYFIMKDKQLTIQLKDETGFECSTEISDIDIPDGTYILPPLTFNILKKSENLEMFLTEKNAYFRETANNYVIKYVTPTMMKR